MSQRFHIRRFFDSVPEADVLVIEKEPTSEMHTNSAYFYNDYDTQCLEPMGLFEFRWGTKTCNAIYDATTNIKPGVYHRKDFLRRYETWLPYEQKMILRKMDKITSL